MKSAIAEVLLILILCVAGFGFYRGWFSASSNVRDTPAKQAGVSLTVDRDRVKEDARSAQENTTELAGKATGEAEELGDPRQETK